MKKTRKRLFRQLKILKNDTIKRQKWANWSENSIFGNIYQPLVPKTSRPGEAFINLLRLRGTPLPRGETPLRARKKYKVGLKTNSKVDLLRPKTMPKHFQNNSETI